MTRLPRDCEFICHRSALGALSLIELLPKAEQRQLGYLLARDSPLPGWRVLRDVSYVSVSPQGMSGLQARFYDFLRGRLSPVREIDAIRYLWPRDATHAPSARLKSRLRGLIFKANKRLVEVRAGTICRQRGPRGIELYLH